MKRVTERTEMLVYQTAMEPIVTGRHWRMCGEDNFTRDSPRSFIKVHAFFVHPASNRFEHGKRAVPFIQVKDRWCDSHSLQGPEASDAEEQLLTNSNASIAAVKPG